MWIPNGHLAVRDSHLQRCVSAQMLIREEEYAFALRKGPFEYRLGIATGANDAPMPTAKCLEACCAVDIGDWGHVGRVDDVA